MFHLILKQPGKVIDFPRPGRSAALESCTVKFAMHETGLASPLGGHAWARRHELFQVEEFRDVAVSQDSEPSCHLGRGCELL